MRKNPKAKLLRDAAETMFMNRPELAVAFRTADGSRLGSLDAGDLTEMLMNSRLKTGLDRREAKEVALELFNRVGKDPNTVARVNFNDLAIAIGDVLEGKEVPKQQPGAAAGGAGEDSVRVLKGKKEDGGRVMLEHRERRSKIIEDQIAQAIWSSRALAVSGREGVGGFKAASIQIRHAMIKHVTRGRDTGMSVDGDLMVRGVDLEGVMYAVGIYLTGKQAAYIRERCERDGMVECKALVRFLAVVVGM